MNLKWIIRGGWPGANPTDDIFFKSLPKLKFSAVAFGMMRKHKVNVKDDIGLKSPLIQSYWLVWLVNLGILT